ncbi:hypothetical protein ACG04R_09465 [Roseateles sp. BYS78W]|uniref:Uncharacterized protein n=1 Tax=Pelomonas candidula TaxID=3299025 RepID=A0ABW7HAF4_9BURK
MAFEGPPAGLKRATHQPRFEPLPVDAAPPPSDGHATASDAAHHRNPGGSSVGRLMRRSRTRTAGIRFEWAMRTCGPVLRVVATWTDHQGQPHHTSYSVQSNGLEGALDRAIASRISCGAPQPDREDLLRRLKQEFATAPQSASPAAAAAVATTAKPSTCIRGTDLQRG